MESSKLTPYASFTKPLSSLSTSPLYTPGGRVRITPSQSEEYNDIITSTKNYNEITDKAESKKSKKELCGHIKDYFKCIGLDTTIIDAEFVLGIDVIVDTGGEIIVQLLDGGIHQIILDIPTGETNHDYEAVKNILDKYPRERLGIHYPSLEYLYEHQDLLALVEKISVNYNRFDDLNLFWNLLNDMEDCLTNENTLVFVCNVCEDMMSSLCSLTQSLFEKKAKASLALTNPTPSQLGQAYASCIKCDRKDGLYSTVVCTRDGHALGLVYSSKESIIKSLETGRGVYYSRSRQSLWKKGDTSGHYQTLHRIDIDCDRDAVLFTVTQHGKPNPAFCHLNTLSCWGELRGLHHLQSTLQSRLTKPEPGSYTQRLFHDEELLKQKLLEESLELMEAKTKQHVAEELADVMYFALVQAAKFGVGIEDATRELEKRGRKVTRRKGDCKVERIEEGKKVLESIRK